MADELGSGMRNTYKYTKLYSGGIPEFCEGDMFIIKIPLNQVSLAKVGPNKKTTGQDTERTTERTTERMTERTNGQAITKKSVADIEKAILNFCKKPKSRKEIQEYFGLSAKSNFIEKYIKPLLKVGKLNLTIPDKPSSKNQKYISKSSKKRKVE